MKESTSAFIVGGKSPIALAIAEKLVEHCNVILLTRDLNEFRKRVSTLPSEIEVREGNLLDSEFLDKFRMLITKRKITRICFAHRSRDEQNYLDRYFVDAIQPYLMIEALVAEQQSEDKRVVVITSPASQMVVNDQDYFYHVNKAALSTLVRYCAVKFGRSQLQINGVAPSSFVEKERSRNFYQQNPQLTQRILDAIPGSMFTHPNDIAEQVRYLLFAAPRTLNGTEATIDSGLTLVEQSTFPKINPLN